MNKRFIGVLIFAFIIAASGGLLTYRQLVNRAPAKPAAQMAHVVVAAHDVEAGSILKAGDLTLGDWPGTAPAGTSAKVEDLLGRGVITPIYSKEPVVESRLAAKGSGGGLAAMIPTGMRAFAVRVNDVAGVAGFATPGMRVDVVINGSPPGSVGPLASTLLQNVEVLSAGQDFKRDAEGKPIITQVVTLVVSPDQAEKLSLAVNQAQIQLVLRNPIDREAAKVPGAAFGALFGVSSPRPAEAAAPVPVASPKPAHPAAILAEAQPKRAEAEPVKTEPPFKMEITLGSKTTEVVFNGNKAEAR